MKCHFFTFDIVDQKVQKHIFNNILIVLRYDFSKFLEKVTLLR